jgi:hypothetical protein
MQNKLRRKEMAKARPDLKEMALTNLDASITTLFETESGDSPIIRQVAYSMWNQCMNLYEENLAKPRHDFFDLDEFIEFIKRSGVPEEIRDDRECMLKVLGAGYDTFLEVVDIDSPLLRKVSYRTRRRSQFRFDWLKPLPNKPLPEDQLVEALSGHFPPEWPELKQHIELHDDTIFWSLEAPKIEGRHCCGVAPVVLGLVKPSLKFCVLDSYLPKLWLEMLVKHPVEVEIVDNPIVREGATSCDIRIHLRPSVYTYKKEAVF